MNRYAMRVCVVMTALVTIAGCTSHHKIVFTQNREPLSVNGRVRVTKPDFTRVYIDSVTLTPDSVVGRQMVRGSAGSQYQRVAIPMTNETKVETIRVNVPKTIVIVLVSWFLLGGIVVATQGVLGGGS